MSAKSLYKLFYSDKKQYEAEYSKRFGSDDTIHFDLSNGESKFFIYPSSSSLNTIIEIERIDKKINEIAARLPDIATRQFANRCLIEEVVKTNDIEGVHSTRKEISEIIENIDVYSKSDRFVGLVNKYTVLMNSEDIPLSACKDIRKIYDDIFVAEIEKDDIPDGQYFRAKGVSVCGNDGKPVHHGLFPEKKIITAMNEALGFLNNGNCDRLIRIAAFHFLFCYIHPFYDGNGRMSRFISCYLLSKYLNPLIGYRLSYTVKERLGEYYKGFTICEHPNSRGELTPFVEMFLQIILQSEEQLLEELTDKYEKLTYYEKLIPSLPNSGSKYISEIYELLIQASLFSHIGISRSDLMKYLNIGKSTLSELMKLIPGELLISNRESRRIYYMLDTDKVVS